MTKEKETIKDLIFIKMQALYDMETEITKALPDMVEAATDADLKKAFKSHLKETETHMTRLEEAFKLLGHEPKKIKVAAIRGLVEDATWIIKQKMTEEATDAMLIAAASYVENYEKAGYMAIIRWAEELGDHDDLVELLQANLDEEEVADEKLKTLAEDSVDAKVGAVA